jgi:hypothetical protein
MFKKFKIQIKLSGYLIESLTCISDYKTEMFSIFSAFKLVILFLIMLCGSHSKQSVLSLFLHSPKTRVIIFLV